MQKGFQLQKRLLLLLLLLLTLPLTSTWAGAEEAGRNSPEYYVIKKGDTLWDITRKLLKDPLKWRRVWRLNPHIKNPDLIYPGNRVRITPAGEIVITAPDEPAPAEPAPVAPAPAGIPSAGIEAAGDGTMIVSITLNHTPKGDFFVQAAPGGDFLIRMDDFGTMGLKDVRGETSAVGGESHVSLRSMPGVTFTYDEDRLALAIEVPPELLPGTTIDYMPRRHPRVTYTDGETSAFFNYRLDYIAEDDFDFQSFDVTSELGLRAYNVLFQTDSTFTKTPGDERFVRLTSNVTYDSRSRMQRLVAGDFFASSGELGSNLNMGGLSLAKVYRIDPYFIRQPTFGTTGLLATPSDVEVYLDGMLIEKELLAPGEFELKNISSYSGASDIELVIKDALGRVKRVSLPFYFSDSVLAKGLHEYSYNAGFLREGFGTRSNDYGRAAFSAFHRYGFSDSLTAGFEAEGAEGVLSLGPVASYLSRRAGVSNLAFLMSHESGGRYGYAGTLAHSYLGKHLGARLLFRGFSRDFGAVDKNLAATRPRYEAGSGVSYGDRVLGTVSLDYSVVDRREGSDRKILTATYSRGLLRNASLYATFRNINENDRVNNELFVVFTYHPRQDTFLSASGKVDGDSDREEFQVMKNAPVGEGFGYRGSYAREDLSGVETNSINSFLQYNGRYGVYTGEYRAFDTDTPGSEVYELTASGGVVYAGGAVGLSRPVTDSFGVVKVADIEGVSVYNNNQEVGRTGPSGRVFVTDMSSYYDNQISIDSSNVPMNYTITDAEKAISPAFRSGSLIEFPVKRFQAVTGRLRIGTAEMQGAAESAEFAEVKMDVDGSVVTFSTGRDGEFYLEDIPPGSYAAGAEFEGRGCTLEITIPESDEVVIDLGEVTCEETL